MGEVRLGGGLAHHAWPGASERTSGQFNAIEAYWPRRPKPRA
jgi:hypothetical protein